MGFLNEGRALSLMKEALSGTGVRVRLEDDDTVVFFLLDRVGNEAQTYRFSPGVYRRIDAFIYGVRFATGFEPFTNDAVNAVVELLSTPASDDDIEVPIYLTPEERMDLQKEKTNHMRKALDALAHTPSQHSDKE